MSRRLVARCPGPDREQHGPWRTIACLILAVTLSAICVTADARTQRSPFQQDQKRVALVIGVGAYQNVPALANPSNDAAAVAAALGRLGFEVHAHLDPSRLDFEAILSKFRRALVGADVALLYYAGHSIQVDGENFLIPTDAAFAADTDFDSYLVDTARVDALMEQSSAVRVTILDACRDNPFLDAAGKIHSTDDNTRSLSRGLAPIAPPASIDEQLGGGAYGSVTAYSAAPGQTASDGTGKHSPYTAALLRHIEEPDLEIGRMFRKIAASVIAETKEQQQPEYLVRLTDEVYFRDPEPSDCDHLAAAPYNSIGMTGVDFERIDAAKAIPACEAAVAKDPEHKRHLYNLGRAYDAAGQFKEAVSYYREAAERGYPAAKSSLGVMQVNGQGTDQDFVSGVALLNEARALGSRPARISLTATDFSVLFEKPEYAALQEALKKTGHYTGTVDGIDGPGTRAALSAYQSAQGHARNGVTLETLDALGLLGIIPNYELN